MYSETLKKYLLNELKDTSSSVLTGTISLTLTKRELLTMSKEELEFVKSFVDGYRNEYRMLHPKSFEHFLNSNKYDENCTVVVKIPLEELINKGILTISENGLKAYWYLYGEKLDPKQYYRLYLKDQKTFKTLLEELGLSELINMFGIEPTPQNSLAIFKIKLDDINLYAHYTSTNLSGLILSTLIQINGSVDTELPQDTLVDIRININNPMIEDILKVKDFVRSIRSDVKVKINKIVEWIKKNFEDRVGEMHINVSGAVFVKNFKFDIYTFHVKGQHKIDDNTIVAIDVQYNDPQELKISVSQTIESRYLIKALKDIDMKSMSFSDDGKEYVLDINTEDKTVSLRISKRFDVASDLENLPKALEEIDTIMNTKTILYDMIAKGLEKIKDMKPILYDRSGRKEMEKTVRELLELVGWRNDQSVEEAILRIWMIKTIIDNLWEPEKIKPDIVSILMSLTYLRGASHDYVLNNVKMGLDYAIKLALRGRLKITEHDVYLDGRRFDINPTNHSFIGSVLDAIKFLASSEKRNRSIEETKNIIVLET
ncbi:MAG: hypothetical protein QW607_11595 [Desulfurococcaceae archaeon]